MKFFLILLLLPSIAFAFEQTDCFQYYRFQNGILFDSLNPEKIVYKPGEDVIISYKLISKMESPIVEGKIRAQIFYNDPEEGEIMIDEFLVENDVNIMYNEVIPKEFRWKVPKGAKNGEYIVKLYFIVGDTFNLGGISFIAYGPPGVPGEQTTFFVENSDESYLYFSKKETYLNEEKYLFGTSFPGFERDGSFTIRTKLINKGYPKDVTVTMKVYDWDDLTEVPIGRYTKIEEIRLDSERDIIYNIPYLNTGAYLVKIIAQSGEEKSILKMRFYINGAKGRFLYTGITNFPLKANEENKLFVCLSNAADYSTSFNGRVNVYLYDENGNKIFEDMIQEEIIPKPMGFVTSFRSRDYKYITLSAELYGPNNELMDKVFLTYDYSKFKNIPRFVEVRTDKDEYSPGEEIRYTISYKDDSDYPLEGNILVSINSEDKIITSFPVNIRGTFRKTLTINNPGEYKILVIVPEYELKSEKSFIVGYATGMPTNIDLGLMRILLIVSIVTCIVVALRWKLKK